MIYIGVPSHDEGRTVGVLLWKIRQVMTEFPRDYQLIVVDDASTDATPAVLAPYARVLPLTVIRFRERQGYAACLEELVREAAKRSSYPRRDVLVTLQADFTDDPEEIPNLLKRIESGADVVTSALRIESAAAPRGVRWTARLAVPLLRRRMAWPEPVTDALSGFRAYRVFGLRKALEVADGRRLLQWDGWAANAALLDAVKPHVRRMDEVEVLHRWERRQRDSRFEAWPTLRSLVRLAFGRPAPAPAVSDLAAVERSIMGDPGLAERVAATEVAPEPEPTRRRRARKASDHTGDAGSARKRRSGRNGASAQANGARAAADAAPDAPAEGAGEGEAEKTKRTRTRRRRGGRRRSAGKTSAGTETGAATETGAEAASGPGGEAATAGAGGEVESGGGRSGNGGSAGARKRPARRKTAGPAGAGAEAADGGAEDSAGGAEAGAAEADASAAVEGEDGEGRRTSTRRRRRGGRGRGGRRRRSGAAGGDAQGGEEQSDAAATGGAEVSAGRGATDRDGAASPAPDES